ncbi:MAG TPA: sigma-70 family RNA polymerase sigma factor [Acidimicrobiia bacterium]|nr:sigma-70 family RNA polymerase sigma factor [Acidimicrobiia bacterium]
MTDITGPFNRSHHQRIGPGRRIARDLPRSARTRREDVAVVEEPVESRHTTTPDEFGHLLSQARSGSTWAWSQLYDGLAGPLLGYLRVRGAAEPEDLLSEVFLQMVRGLHAFEGDSQQFRSWVFTIAHRRLIDERRARSKRPVELREDLEPAVVAEDPATTVIDRLTDEEIIGFLDALTPEQRDVLLLRLLAGLTIDEIARALGKTPGAVKALQRRGLLTLQETLSSQ